MRETRGPRVCKTEPGKLRNDQFIIFVRGRPRPLTDAHKLRNSETLLWPPLRPGTTIRRIASSEVNHNGILIAFLPFPCNESHSREFCGTFSRNARKPRKFWSTFESSRSAQYSKKRRDPFSYVLRYPWKFEWTISKFFVEDYSYPREATMT